MITPKKHYVNKRAFGNLSNVKGASQAEKGDPEEIHHPGGCWKPVLCYARLKASFTLLSWAGLEIHVRGAGQAHALRLAVPVWLVLYRSGLLGGSSPEDVFGWHLGQAGGCCWARGAAALSHPILSGRSELLPPPCAVPLHSPHGQRPLRAPSLGCRCSNIEVHPPPTEQQRTHTGEGMAAPLAKEWEKKLTLKTKV